MGGDTSLLSAPWRAKTLASVDDSDDSASDQEARAAEVAAEAEAAADRCFASLLRRLLRGSHFRPLTRRDCEIAKSLNGEDYLGQLFILGNSRLVTRQGTGCSINLVKIKKDQEEYCVFSFLIRRLDLVTDLVSSFREQASGVSLQLVKRVGDV